MASHLPRFLTATCRVMMILPSPQGHHDKPKSLPTIKEGSRTSDTIKKGIHVKRKRASHWQLRGSLGRKASTLAPFVGSFAQLTVKMSTPSKSCSSARGYEGYFEWREAMKR
ncbi:hypothetical protein CK203_098036 [Vitis vinifera]|uniref:Uncharacterized protein n=1 Tax=Vitis vinifera TaxID=29760 RepID=A0A438CRW6_VITVI|nr:hypothetical protein CK203_098036 [Vitis vinifera]